MYIRICLYFGRVFCCECSRKSCEEMIWACRRECRFSGSSLAVHGCESSKTNVLEFVVRCKFAWTELANKRQWLTLRELLWVKVDSIPLQRLPHDRWQIYLTLGQVYSNPFRLVTVWPTMMVSCCRAPDLSLSISYRCTVACCSGALHYLMFLVVTYHTHIIFGIINYIASTDAISLLFVTCYQRIDNAMDN